MRCVPLYRSRGRKLRNGSENREKIYAKIKRAGSVKMDSRVTVTEDFQVTVPCLLVSDSQTEEKSYTANRTTSDRTHNLRTLVSAIATHLRLCSHGETEVH